MPNIMTRYAFSRVTFENSINSLRSAETSPRLAPQRCSPKRMPKLFRRTWRRLGPSESRKTCEGRTECNYSTTQAPQELLHSEWQVVLLLFRRVWRSVPQHLRRCSLRRDPSPPDCRSRAWHRETPSNLLGKTTMVDLNALEDDGLKPPTCTKRRGRPKEKRIPSSAQKGPKKSVTCGKCGKRGAQLKNL